MRRNRVDSKTSLMVRDFSLEREMILRTKASFYAWFSSFLLTTITKRVQSSPFKPLYFKYERNYSSN